MPDPLLRLAGVGHAFRGGTSDEVRALDGIDLEIGAGTFAVVLGTNGSGKSSLLNVIAGTLACARGTVWLAGRDITRWPVHRRAALMGRVFQDPFAGTAPDLSVAENMVLAAQRGRRRGPARAVGNSRRAVLREDLARLGLGLEDRLDTPVGLLSGGQRQAVTVLMATQSAPSLLLLDEHTAALDPRSGDQVVALTREIIASRRITTLMVTHVMSQAAHLGDRILLMHRGRIVHDLSGPARATLREPDLLQMFDELAWAGRLDTGTAAMLERSWI